jgi:hypothetical protein
VADTLAAAEDERNSIEQALNEKMEAMGGWSGAFGFGHGVDVWALTCAWVERELIPHERRLNARIGYDIRMRPGGANPRIVITSIGPSPAANGPPGHT